MKATFVITHGDSSRAAGPISKAAQMLGGLYGKDVYVRIGVREEALEEALRFIRASNEIVSIEDKTIEIGPYLVLYKLIKTV